MEPGLVRGSIDRVRAGVRGVGCHDPSDLVQEAVARAISAGVSLDSEAWLRTVARRVAIDRSRRRREVPSGGAAELDALTTATGGDPEDHVLRAETSAEVQGALAKLPPRYRAALLASIEEDSPADVAQRLGLTPNATWTLLSRARTRLRTQLERVGYVPAVLIGRWKWQKMAAGGAAVGIAVTIAVGPAHRPAPKVAAPRLPVAADVVSTKSEPRAPKASTTKVAAPAVQKAHEGGHADEPAQPKVQHRIDACVPGENDEPVVGADFWVVEDGTKSILFDEVYPRLPAALGKSETGTC